MCSCGKTLYPHAVPLFTQKAGKLQCVLGARHFTLIQCLSSPRRLGNYNVFLWQDTLLSYSASLHPEGWETTMCSWGKTLYSHTVPLFTQKAGKLQCVLGARLFTLMSALPLFTLVLLWLYTLLSVPLFTQEAGRLQCALVAGHFTHSASFHPGVSMGAAKMRQPDRMLGSNL